MQAKRRFVPRLLPLVLLASGVGTWLSSCDSPACIFGGGCLTDGDDDGNGAGATTSVAFPIDGEWVLPGAPTIVDTFPKDNASLTSPVVIVFSESLNPSTALDGFEVEREDGMPEGGGPVSALVGDGRVLIIFPALPFSPGTDYVVRYAAGAEVTDLTGVPITQPVSGIVGSFTSGTAPSQAPQLVMSYPPNNASSQSELGEIITVFDRQLDDLTVDAASFVVGLGDQALDPATAPEPLVISSLGSFDETRVYRWRHRDANGNPLALPLGARVVVTLSPSGGPAITDEADIALPQTSFQFDLAPFGIPTSGSLASQPEDAIGIDNLVGTLNPLMMLVEFPQPVQQGDQVDVLVFGVRPEVEGELPSNIAFERTIPLVADETAVLIERDALALVASVDPLVPIVDDGQIAFAYRYRRGSNVGPVRLLDVEPSTPGIQDAILDTVAPQLTAIGASGTGASAFRSDLFDLALVGRASEELRSVEVAVTLDGGKVLTNGALPGTTGADASGLFVAAPIAGELFPQAASLTAELDVTLYDRALNTSPAVQATYLRTGGVVLDANETTLELFVYDARTRAPISAARCFLHTRTQLDPFSLDDGVLFDQAATQSDGSAFLTIDTTRLNSVTVDADGYDLFTLQGVMGGTLAVPLAPIGFELGAAQLNVTTAGMDGTSYVSEAADSRRAPLTEPLILGAECAVNPFTNEVTCTFAPWGIELGRIGALSWFATDPAESAATFDAADYLRSFGFGYPRPALTDPEQIDLTTFDLPLELAQEPDPAEHAVAVPAHQFDRNAIPGQSSVSIPPAVRVESVSPGVADRVVVGVGTTFDANNDLVYDVRAAFPGAVDPFVAGEADAPGRLVQSGAVADRLYLVVESIDPSTSITAVRTLLTGSAPAQPLDPIGIPLLTEPSDNILPGPAFSVVFTAVLPVADAGLYSAVLTEQPVDVELVGRSWRLYRIKPAGEDAELVVAHFPDIAAGGGMPLLEPAQRLVLGAITTQGFSPAAFRWVDLQLEASLEARGAPIPLVLLP